VGDLNLWQRARRAGLVVVPSDTCAVERDGIVAGVQVNACECDRLAAGDCPVDRYALAVDLTCGRLSTPERNAFLHGVR